MRDTVWDTLGAEGQSNSLRRAVVRDTEEIGFSLARAVSMSLTALKGDPETGLESLLSPEDQVRFLSTAAAQSTNLIYLTDATGSILYVNPMFERTTGWKRHEVIGSNPRILASGDTPAAHYENLWATLMSGHSWQGNLKNRTRDGQLWWANTTITPIRDGSGKLAYFVAVQDDVTWLRVCGERVEQLVSKDPLTGLPNRQQLIEAISRWVIENDHQDDAHAALLLINIDDFRAMNRFGNVGAGDELLVALADCLPRLVAEATPEVIGEGLVARLYGDEFGLFVPHCRREAAIALGEATREAVSVTGSGAMVSIGVALAPEHANTAHELITIADIAMTHAKDIGGDRVRMYRPQDGVREQLHRRFAQKRLILRGLGENRFVPWYQPILNVKRGCIDHYEALARMVEVDGSIVGPDRFIAAAERLGLIGSLQRVITRKAIRTQVRQAAVGQQFNIALNLSGKQLGDSKVLEFLQSEIETTGIDPKNLTFEITETAAITDLDRARHFVGALKMLGCRFSLDDFGVGFASFRYLRELQVDCIKIDGSFVSRIHESPTDLLLVRAMVDVARGMGIETVAEFVEKQETLDLLTELGIDFAQGYLIGRPAPAEELWET